jgi:hypothetical protein
MTCSEHSCNECSLYDKGDRPTPCFKRVAETALDILEELETMKQELEDERNSKLLLEEMHYENGIIDMKLSGEHAMFFLYQLVQLFEQNGGKNYLTMEVRNGAKHYEITIRNCNAYDTPALKIQRLEETLRDISNYLYDIMPTGELSLKESDFVLKLYTAKEMADKAIDAISVQNNGEKEEPK